MNPDSLYQAGPSAFSAAEIDLEQLFDLDQFPIHNLSHPRRKELVEYCRSGLAEDRCSHVSGFVRASALDSMCKEATSLISVAAPAEDKHNPYFSDDDPDYPATHPVRRFAERIGYSGKFAELPGGPE